ncbi:hypothetical protein AYO38_08365 [bacterium SCGC AG-212-C10]|nr:hypothetical protein AYO38_08365 [bacterium SCGC AG-212-C10]
MSAKSGAGTYAPFASSDYRLLWSGTCLYFLAFVISMVAQAVIAYDLTGKNSAVGLVALCSGISLTIGSPIGGVLADRVDKRRLLVLSQLAIAALFVIVGTLMLSDLLTVALLAGMALLINLCSCVIMPARQAWSPATLPPEQAGDGAALQALAVTLMGLIGPFIGGLIIAVPFLGLGGAYLTLAGFMLVTVLLVLRTRAASPRPAAQAKPLADLQLGLIHVFTQPRLAVLMLSFYGVILAGSSYAVLLPGFIEDRLGRDASDVTWLMTMSGLGGLVSTGLVSLLPSSRQTTTLLAVGGMIMGVGLALVGGASSFGIAMAFMLVVGIGMGMVQLLNTALIMREAEPQYYGRVMSLVMLGWGINGVAALGLGLLADGIGAGRTLAVMGAVAVMIAAAMWAALRGLGARGEPTVRAQSTLSS